jgi:hypothetical protein
MNVTKITQVFQQADHANNKSYTSDSEIEGRHLQTDISRKRKIKNPNPSNKLLMKRQMSTDHLDSGEDLSLVLSVLIQREAFQPALRRN